MKSEVTDDYAVPSADAVRRTEEIRAIERKRLAALLARDADTARQLHAPDFQLVNPTAAVVSREVYLAGVASGDVNCRLWEPDSPIDVRMYLPAAAVIRYRSRAEVVLRGELAPFRGAWHMDVYEMREEGWQVVWSQATGIA